MLVTCFCQQLFHIFYNIRAKVDFYYKTYLIIHNENAIQPHVLNTYMHQIPAPTGVVIAQYITSSINEDLFFQ